MNLDFGILWIEDSFSTEENKSLERRVREAGFIARIENVPNGEDIERLSRLHKLYHRYDIILLDYKLQDANGDELAPQVRRLFPSTTIMFYSGNAEENQLRRMIAEKAVEGVFCSSRARFIERTGALIDHTARSLDRLPGMRGLAMRVVAECDELMKSSVLFMTERDPKCAQKVGDLDAAVESFLRKSQEKYEKAKRGDLKGRLVTHLIDSSKLFAHFRRLIKEVSRNPETFGLDQVQIERIRELSHISAQYEQNVLKKRNILGHVAEEQGPNGWVLKGSDEISTSDFPEIRRVFVTHIDAFREIHNLVTFLDGQQSA